MNRRLGAVGLSFVLFTLVIIARLVYWQILKGSELSRTAENQYLTTQNLVAPRGDIRASDGFPLVTNKTVYTLAVDPTKIANDSSFVSQISRILNAGSSISDVAEAKKTLQGLVADKNLHWVSLAKDLPTETAEQIKKLSLPGVDILPSKGRDYPESSMAASLLGIVASDKDGSPTGYFGLEGYYNRELLGRNGLVKGERDALGSPIMTGKFEERPAQSGKGLELYLDRGAQFIAEKELTRGLQVYGASSGTVTIMDPKTGAILAMASLPSYDPRKYVETSQELLHNPVIGTSFEPGSIFKPFVMAAAINEKAVFPDTICDRCSGPWQVGEYSIHTWNDKYYPGETMTEVIQHSDNVGMTFVMDKLDRHKFIDYLKNFGFGQPTGIDLQDEDTPQIRDEKNWYPIDFATSSFGQGIAVTPIQLVRAMGAIANGGLLVEPHVVAKVVGDLSEVEIKPKIVRRVIDAEAAKSVSQMMLNAVENGEAKWTSIKGFKIAGKTGTAQIPVGGKYEKEKTNASFIGFAPVDNARFVMLVTLHNPTTSPWAAETAAPLWFSITRDLLTYWGMSNFK